jgi:hypothetical protein
MSTHVENSEKINNPVKDLHSSVEKVEPIYKLSDSGPININYIDEIISNLYEDFELVKDPTDHGRLTLDAVTRNKIRETKTESMRIGISTIYASIKYLNLLHQYSSLEESIPI